LPSRTIITSAGSVAEPLEGMRVGSQGSSGRPSRLADGLGVVVEDASGSIRAVIERDVSERKVIDRMASPCRIAWQTGGHTSGSSGHRIYVTQADDVQLDPRPLHRRPWSGRQSLASRPVTVAAPRCSTGQPAASRSRRRPCTSPTKAEPARPRVDRRPLSRNVVRVIMLASLVAAFALAAGDPMKFPGSGWLHDPRDLKSYREVRWLDAGVTRATRSGWPGHQDGGPGIGGPSEGPA
jgi:hypothetical protein